MTSITTYTYDVNGDRISESIDSNSDGIADSIITYRYNLIFESSNSDNNGTVDAVTTYTYDGKGNIISQISDNNNEMTVHLILSAFLLMTPMVTKHPKAMTKGLTAFLMKPTLILTMPTVYRYLRAVTGMVTAIADILTGGNGVDIFIFEYLSDSLLPNFDVIKDLKIGVDNINAQRAVNAADVAQLGNINALVESQIQGLLNITTFVANKAAIFSLGTGTNQQTFLALNDAINGLSASNDAIIEITGFNGNLAKLAIV